jgi:hypothetical protein
LITYLGIIFHQMKRAADFKQKNAAILDNLMPADEENALLENRVVNVLVDRDQKGRRILVTYNGGKYLRLTPRKPHTS